MTNANDLLREIRRHNSSGLTKDMQSRIDEVLALQAEPVEPAPAQDEQEAVAVVGYAFNLESGAYSQYPGEDWSALMTVAQHERIVAALTRPAQTEQQFIRLPERKRTDHLPKEYKTMTVVRAGLEAYNRALDDVAALNAAPIAQTEQPLERSALSAKGTAE